MTKAIKEIIIMLLICLAIMLLLAIAFYQYIPNRKNVPEIQTYTVSEEVQDLLEDDIMTRSTDAEPVETYKVTSSDLKTYQTEQEYIPGKINPFDEYSSKTTVEDPNGTSNPSDGEHENISTTPKLDTNEPSVYTGGNGTK